MATKATQQKPPHPRPTSTHLCPDWVFSDQSNVHIVKDVEWFEKGTYQRQQLGNVTSLDSPSTILPIHGFGNVTLKVKRKPGQEQHGEIKLMNALHVPGIACNIIAATDSRDVIREEEPRTVKLLNSMGAKGEILDKHGEKIAYFDPGKKLLQLVLSKWPIGKRIATESALQNNGSNLIHWKY